MRRRSALLPLLLLVPLALLTAACGSDDDGGAIEVGDGGEGADGDDGAGPDLTQVFPVPPGGAVDTTVPVDPDTPVSDDGNSSSGGGGDAGAPVGGEARIVHPTPGLVGVVEATLDSAVLRDGNKVEARFYGGVADCYGVDHVDVVESPTDVTITVFTGSPPEAAARTCIEIAELQAVIVPLDAPLGDRVVLDGSSGAQVPLS